MGEDSFKISGLAVKDMTIKEKILDEQHLLVKCLLLDQKMAISTQDFIYS